MSKPIENILGAIGNTPIFKINKLAPEGINIYVKAESFNPMGSVKDRMAVSTRLYPPSVLPTRAEGESQVTSVGAAATASPNWNAAATTVVLPAQRGVLDRPAR